MLISNQKTDPQVGDFLKPDGWQIGSQLEQDNGFSDSSFPGCQFRLPSGQWPNYHLAVNVTVTGGKHAIDGMHTRTRSRCKIEFVGDGEPSTFTAGWITQDI